MAGFNKYKYLLKNTGLATIGGLGSKILVYLLVRFYTSVLTTEEYGLASTVSETATLLLPVISLGIADAVFRFAMDKEFNKNEVFSAGFTTLAFGCLSFLLVVPALLWVDLLDGYEWVVVSYILCSSVHSICHEFVRAQGRYGLCAVQDYSAAIENMLLAIQALGYASCWIEGHVTDVDQIGRQMADILGVPENMELVCFLPTRKEERQGSDLTVCSMGADYPKNPWEKRKDISAPRLPL